MFKNKVVLITGGTGSFGQTIVKEFLKLPVKEIRVFSRDEKKQDSMRRKLNNKKITFFIGDTRNYNSVVDVMHNVDFIFHAAALKQVPSCEFFPMQAVYTNIIGTENVLRAAKNATVRKVIVLSTDKAVYPINAMGMSKALMEKIASSKSKMDKTSLPTVCITRYGNVMGSRGSVIPLFIDQIKSGKPITITDPNMTRFLMSLDDSVNLVLYAFKYGKSGDTFVQKSPASTVLDLAKAIDDLLGTKSKIKTIGTRHGEKLYETLVSKEEMFRAKIFKEYFKIESDNRDLNYNKFFDSGQKSTALPEEFNSHNTDRLTISQIKKLFMSHDYLKGMLNA